MKFNPLQHPGSEYRRVICDVCGRKLYAKDVVQIKDRWNYQNNLVVCREDADRVNDQVKPITTHEKPVSDPDNIRIELDPTFVTVNTDSRAPGIPYNIRGYIDSLTGYLNLVWNAPDDPGTSGILYFTLRRADPQLGTYTTLGNTTDGSPYYADSSATISTAYTYIISATNSYGTGSYSTPFYWPTQQVNSDINYLVVSQDDTEITMGDGTYITL